MDSSRKNPGSAREPEHTPKPRLSEERRRRLVHTGEAVALALAAVALACLIASCSGSDPQASTTSSTPNAEQIAETAAQPAGLTPVTGHTRLGVESLPTVTAADSLPPDVSAWGPDSVLAPGSVVEISAKGSDDVVEMVLADGIGKKQWMVYDETQDVWRTFYRVPVNGSASRLGLSVTAKNNLSRWHRVWVFLEIQLDGC